MTQKEVAISAMKSLDIYKPYIKKFEKDGTVTLFERFGGYYIEENNEPELLKKIREFEAEYGSLVYAVTHTFTQFGELYEFLCISKHEEEWEDTLEDLKEHYAWSYVWNKTDDYCSEFGTIEVKSFGGGIARVG
jgi:hypothetical protein